MRKVLILLAAVLLLPAMSTVPASALTTQEEPTYNGYLVSMNPSAPMMISMSDEIQEISGIDNLYWVEDEADAQAFIDMGLADYIEPNIILEELDVDTTPNDPLYTQDEQWTLSTIDYSTYYSSGYDGTGVTVAVIDSGLYISHQDIDTTIVSECSKNFLGDGSDAANALYSRDQTGHGTFVASQIAATTNNGIGMAGIASDVELMILRCISDSSSAEFTYDSSYDNNSGSVAVVSEAIIYAAEHGADVINLSLGTSTNSQTLANAVSYAQNMGVIIVAAVGNNSDDTLYYPAACEGVIGVGSVTQSNDTLIRSTFSQYNDSVDVTAPGGTVMGIYVNTVEATTNQYATGSGTSYSAPVVAAVIAAAKEKLPELTTENVLSLFAVSSVDYGTAGRDSSFGYGVVNEAALFDAMDKSYDISYVLNDEPDSLASLLVDYTNTYIMSETTTLPIPTRTGYSFDGWYTDENFTGDAVTEQAVGTLGALISVTEDSDQYYAIDDITYYAKWIEESLTTPTSVTVSGFEATAGDGDTYTVTIPNDAEAVTESSITIEVPSGSSASTPTTTDNTIWSFTVSSGNASTSYTLIVTDSNYVIPTINTEASVTGNAYLASLDEKTAIIPYEVDVSGWFSNGDAYVTIYDGTGTVAITENKLTYTPAETDQVGQAVTITVGGANTDFTSTDVVTITITIGRAVSNSTLSPATDDYDIYTDDDLAVTVTLYNNTFVSLTCSDSTLTASDYVIALPNGDDVSDTMTITLQQSWLQELSTGSHILTFTFSAGDTATLTLTVADSIPIRTVTFYLAEGDSDAYAIMTNVRDGDTLESLPTSPTKSGYTFIGWYLADGTTCITASTTVTSGLTVYASWSEVTSSTSDGTISGGSSSGGSTSGGSSSGGSTTSGSDSGTSDDSGDTTDTTEDVIEDAIEDVEETEDVTEEVADDLTDEVADESDIILEELTVSFTDTSTEDWFYDDVAFVISQNIMNGVGDDSFAPYVAATRGMITTMLHRMEGEPATTIDNLFTDVTSGSYYEVATIWSQECGIVNGYDDGSFAPDEDITREQLATILYRYAQYKGYDTESAGALSDFTDEDAVSDYATTATSWAYGIGLLTGKGDGTLDPTGTALRCEIAAILQRFAQAFMV